MDVFHPSAGTVTPMELCTELYRIQFGIGQLPLDIRQLRFIAKDTSKIPHYRDSVYSAQILWIARLN